MLRKFAHAQKVFTSNVDFDFNFEFKNKFCACSRSLLMRRMFLHLMLTLTSILNSKRRSAHARKVCSCAECFYIWCWPWPKPWTKNKILRLLQKLTHARNVFTSNVDLDFNLELKKKFCACFRSLRMRRKFLHLMSTLTSILNLKKSSAHALEVCAQAESFYILCWLWLQSWIQQEVLRMLKEFAHALNVFTSNVDLDFNLKLQQKFCACFKSWRMRRMFLHLMLTLTSILNSKRCSAHARRVCSCAKFFTFDVDLDLNLELKIRFCVCCENKRMRLMFLHLLLTLTSILNSKRSSAHALEVCACAENFYI
jgi:hypothetical protein